MKWFYIMTNQCSGNCAIFWRTDGRGYTCDVDEAWLVSEDEARCICRSRPSQDFPVPQESVQASKVTHANVNELRRAGFGLTAVGGTGKQGAA